VEFLWRPSTRSTHFKLNVACALIIITLFMSLKSNCHLCEHECALHSIPSGFFARSLTLSQSHGPLHLFPLLVDETTGVRRGLAVGSQSIAQLIFPLFESRIFCRFTSVLYTLIMIHRCPLVFNWKILHLH